MPETYDPRQQSFIKKPEVKLCPTCGQPVQPDVKPMENAMNVYENVVSGRQVVVNSKDAIVKLQGADFYRVNSPEYIEAKKAATVAAQAPAPNVEAPAIPTVKINR